jgi:hypothetical protein
MKKLILISALLLVASNGWTDRNVKNLFCHYSEDTNSGQTLIAIDSKRKAIVLEPVNYNLKIIFGDNWTENQLMIRAENERAMITINRQTLTMQSKLKGKYAEIKLREQEKIQKEREKENRSRAMARFNELMYERPTTLGDLGRLYGEEKRKNPIADPKVDVTITSYDCDLVKPRI